LFYHVFISICSNKIQILAFSLFVFSDVLSAVIAIQPLMVEIAWKRRLHFHPAQRSFLTIAVKKSNPVNPQMI